MRTSIPGVATGLAWTPVGGDILFIEATRIPGKGGFILTGQLGEVMKESAQAALSLVKGKAASLGIDLQAVRQQRHPHPRPGRARSPRTGRAPGWRCSPRWSRCLTGRTVRSDTAMTGEISLRGLVLPVGGIKEKVVAAARAGLGTVILPARNRKDYEEIPEAARNALRFVWAERVEDVIEAALEAAPTPALETGRVNGERLRAQPHLLKSLRPTGLVLIGNGLRARSDLTFGEPQTRRWGSQNEARAARRSKAVAMPKPRQV